MAQPDKQASELQEGQKHRVAACKADSGSGSIGRSPPGLELRLKIARERRDRRLKRNERRARKAAKRAAPAAGAALGENNHPSHELAGMEQSGPPALAAEAGQARLSYSTDTARSQPLAAAAGGRAGGRATQAAPQSCTAALDTATEEDTADDAIGGIATVVNHQHSDRLPHQAAVEQELEAPAGAGGLLQGWRGSLGWVLRSFHLARDRAGNISSAAWHFEST